MSQFSKKSIFAIAAATLTAITTMECRADPATDWMASKILVANAMQEVTVNPNPAWRLLLASEQQQSAALGTAAAINYQQALAAQKTAATQQASAAQKTTQSQEKAASNTASNASSAAPTTQKQGSGGDTSKTDNSSEKSNENGDGSNFDTYNYQERKNTTAKYSLNKSSKIYHRPTCDKVPKIAPQNYDETNESSDRLIEKGYDACGVCKPQ